MYIFTFVAQPGLDILKSLAFCFMFNAGRKKCWRTITNSQYNSFRTTKTVLFWLHSV